MSFLIDLNNVQKEAVKKVEGPTLIVAGAGSGKTRVLTYKVAYLLQIGVPAYQILALTFTNKAADEMKQRIISLVGEKSRQLWMGTFHSLFARILRQESQALGFTSNFSIYDTDDSKKLIKNLLDSNNLHIENYKPSKIHSIISKAKNRLLSPDEFLNESKNIFEEKIAQIYSQYQSGLHANNAMDFDDLIIKPIELFEKKSKILEKYQDRFRFILVDEYQDTNRAQYRLIKLLSKKYQNISVVGDDSQSIYSFRGAEIQNILDFERDFPDCQIFRLEQNYRSTKLILAASDQVIKNNSRRIDKNLWTENTEGEKITVLKCGDDREEASRIVDKIKSEATIKKIDLKDIAVLYRTNAQSRTLEDALRRSSISYIMVGGVEFYKRKEIKDILAYLRLITNPFDNVSFSRIVNYPARGIGETTIKIIEKYAAKFECSYLDILSKCDEIYEFPKKTVNSLKGFYTFIKKYQELLKTLTLSEFSRTLVEEIGILREFKEEGTLEALSRWENVQELLNAITEYSTEKEGSTLEMFLQEVSLLSDIDKWDDSKNRVTLMTLHAAKGLEFKVVFITGLEEGLFPIYSAFLDSENLEEERRLFYVGITRAMDKLYLSHAEQRYKFGELNYSTPSRFLSEIDEHLIEKYEFYYHNRKSATKNLFELRNIRKKKSEVDSVKKYFDNNSYDYENESQLPVNLKIGSVVNHVQFGEGKIIALNGNGSDAKAVVSFESVGQKNLLLKYANLRVIK